MSQQPRLSSVDLWSFHEQTCLGILREALATLAEQHVDMNENDLNRHLYRAIIRTSHEWAQMSDHIPSVVPEGRNPPAASDQERAESEFKIPDFYWAFIDPLAADPNDASKQFVVECKRLTNPTTTYTREYVRSGIARFLNVGHGYGKGMESGAMVGYLQEVPLDDAFAGVNSVACNDGIPALTLRSRNGESGAEFVHDIVRPFPVSPFHLTHIWARIGPEPV